MASDGVTVKSPATASRGLPRRHFPNISNLQFAFSHRSPPPGRSPGAFQFFPPPLPRLPSPVTIKRSKREILELIPRRSPPVGVPSGSWTPISSIPLVLLIEHNEAGALAVRPQPPHQQDHPRALAAGGRFALRKLAAGPTGWSGLRPRHGHPHPGRSGRNGGSRPASSSPPKSHIWTISSAAAAILT